MTLERDINSTHILQMKKQKIKEFSQLHMARKWQHKAYLSQGL